VELGYTFDTSHAGLFRHFAAAYPTLFGLDGDEDLDLMRWVEELGARIAVAHVSDAAGLLGEGLNLGSGELDLDPVIVRLAQLVPFIVAEVNEPDHARSPNMKAGLRALERALERPTEPAPRRVRPPAPAPFDWQAVIGRRDPVPAILELEERFAGGRILITGGCGSIGRRLASLLDGLRPELVTLLDSHEAALTADRRARDPESLVRMEHVLCDVRDPARLRAEVRRAAPDAIFHLAAYKHVDWAERYPEEFIATNLEGSWNVLSAAAEEDVRTVVVASTDKAALGASRYGRTKRTMELLAAITGETSGGERLAVRLVNVLASAGSASDLFLRQARAGGPLTVTDTGMERFWITMAHAAALIAQGALLAGERRLVTAADPVVMSVGDLATRIWHGTGHADDPAIALMGVRPGEVMREVLTGEGERTGPELLQGLAPIDGPEPTAAARALVASLAQEGGVQERRARWTAALADPALLGLPEG
jgi:nucleoside-diphosphate-sugar epimerase